MSIFLYFLLSPWADWVCLSAESFSTHSSAGLSPGEFLSFHNKVLPLKGKWLLFCSLRNFRAGGIHICSILLKLPSNVLSFQRILGKEKKAYLTRVEHGRAKNTIWIIIYLHLKTTWSRTKPHFTNAPTEEAKNTFPNPSILHLNHMNIQLCPASRTKHSGWIIKS